MLSPWPHQLGLSLIVVINLLNSTSCYLISSFQSALFGESDTYVDSPMLRDFRDPIDDTQHLNQKNKR